jgi:UDP-GlcNAc:undecaprenyl-phosphate GlcNAc-1-phosphate transferase
MDLTLLILFTLIIFALELIYFKIADKFDIIDKPNHRSSHTQVTIRGGGIIFPISLFLAAFYWSFEYSYFLLGLFLISTISFIDDIKPTSNKVRLLVHVIAVLLMFYQLNINSLPWYLMILSFVFVIGSVNAINFMDGINGITGGFGLVSAITLFYVNKYQVVFTNESYLVALIMSLLIFNFFNFRTKAKCFAGDVGSVGLAFILLFFFLQLIIKTNNLNYIVLFMLYGLDTSTTIAFRLIKKENIFEAHRQHFYQFLANEKKIPHLVVAVIYTLVQAVINIILIKFSFQSTSALIYSICTSLVIFILIRFYLEESKKLLNLKQ